LLQATGYKLLAISAHSFVPSTYSVAVFPARQTYLEGWTLFPFCTRSRCRNRHYPSRRPGRFFEWFHDQLPLAVPCSCYSSVSTWHGLYLHPATFLKSGGANVLWQSLSGFSQHFCHLLTHLRELSVSTGSKRITYLSEFVSHRWNDVPFNQFAEFLARKLCSYSYAVVSVVILDMRTDTM